MNRIFLIMILLYAPMLSFANSTLSVPSEVTINPNNPASAFPIDIQQAFSISTNLKNDECKKTQSYMLTMLIYRNAVDNKTVGSYRSINTSALCWVDLISYSDRWVPASTASGWNSSEPGENTWCSSKGLSNPLLCAFHRN